MKYTYLLINLFSVLLPLLFSFHSKIRFSADWKFAFPGILISMAAFILWDHYFTEIGVWKFNPDYVLGIYIYNLPVEEYLFFICIPFSCLFIYKIIKLYLKNFISNQRLRYFHALFLIFFFTVAVLNTDKAYSLSASASAFVFLMLLLFLRVKYLSEFYLMYFVSLIFFFMVNGLLTSLPVVLYNDLENSGIRLYTIPMEDTIYSFLMLLIPVSIYEYLQQRSLITESNS
jgi:lycopene cyclase domain-containing protein